MRQYKKHFYTALITFGSIVTTLGLLFLLRLSPDISEGWSRSISRFEQLVASYLFGWLPFSMFELFIWGIIIYVLIWLAMLIRHLVRFNTKGSSKYWLNFGIVISLIFTVYMGTAGMEYNRYPVDIPLHTELINDTSEYKTIASYFQDDYNEISNVLSYNEDGSLIKTYTHNEMNQIMHEEFKKLGSDYYTQETAKAKQMYMWGWLYRELHITGIAFAPTGEANINPLITAGEYPFTMAHEIAHTKGIIREEDANLVAAYICLTSSDPYLRYSGYVWTISSLAYLVKCTNNPEDYKAFQTGFSENCVKDSQARYQYWTNHDMFSKFSNWLNDIYLKIQGNGGTSSYDDNIDVGQEDGVYKVNSYSRYQALYLWIYYDLLGK